MNKRNLHRELCLALNRGDVESAKGFVARGADVNETSAATVQCTLLWLAVDAAGQEISKNFKEMAAGLAAVLPNVPQRDHAAKREQELRVIRMLLESKADINKISRGSTPLRIAVHWGDAEVVKLLLSHGANPNAETFTVLSRLAKRQGRRTLPGYWNTVLHEAAQKGSAPIVEFLLAAGADPNRTDHEGKTALAIAREKGFTELVALLQGKTTVQVAQPFDDIWQAASDGRLSNLERLVAEGVSVNSADTLNATPLHKAAAAGQTHVVKWLLEHGANSNARGWSEAAEQRASTPLHEAARAGHLEIARCLLERGANVNAKMSDRSTPLLVAAGAGRLEFVKLLVAHKATVDAAERGGYTPFIIAVVEGHLETADFLMRRGANLNQRTEPFDMTALMHVAGQKLLKAVQFLLNAGADATLCDTRGQNALHHAISGAVVHKMIDIGPGGDLPEGSPEDAAPIVQLLVASGADPNKRDDEGMTPLDCARRLGLRQIAALLEKKGESAK